MIPTMGRIVRYVAPEGFTRPAIIIETCNARFNVTSYKNEECQLHVYFDGTNDGRDLTPDLRPVAPNPWRTSVPHDEAKTPGTWHWPPKV